MKIKQGLLVRTVAGNKIVIDVTKSETFFKLNETSALIFEELSAGKTEEQIVGIILDTYDVPAEKASEDVKKIIAQFETLGFLVP